MSININFLAADEDVKVIAFHHKALDTIKEMAVHNERVAEAYGEDSPEYLKQIRSFNRVIHSLLNAGFGNQSFVTADGGKSLLVQEGGNNGASNYMFGIVFFRDRRFNDADVQPGEWSVNS